jgi:hypothetical protein
VIDAVARYVCGRKIPTSIAWRAFSRRRRATAAYKRRDKEESGVFVSARSDKEIIYVRDLKRSIWWRKATARAFLKAGDEIWLSRLWSIIQRRAVANVVQEVVGARLRLFDQSRRRIDRRGISPLAQ